MTKEQFLKKLHDLQYGIGDNVGADISEQVYDELKWLAENYKYTPADFEAILKLFSKKNEVTK